MSNFRINFNDTLYAVAVVVCYACIYYENIWVNCTCAESSSFFYVTFCKTAKLVNLTLIVSLNKKFKIHVFWLKYIFIIAALGGQRYTALFAREDFTYNYIHIQLYLRCLYVNIQNIKYVHFRQITFLGLSQSRPFATVAFKRFWFYTTTSHALCIVY